jgi:ubiquinone/menaquinone biosynthesis C-methylase UbiE
MWLLTFYVMIKKKVYKLLNLSGPKTNSLFFDGLGKSCRNVKDYATSWKAMDIIYNHPFEGTLSVGGILDEFYWRSMNCQALRNRYKLIKHLLRNNISQFGKEVRLASLACGSGQAILETIAELKSEGVIVKAILVDINEEALKEAKVIAKKLGIGGQIETFKADLSLENNILKDFKPQIVEMLGFLDYAKEEQAITFLKNINKSLDKKGILITCNINPNPEQHFLKWVINWPMIYRSPSQLINLAEKANFEDCEVILEPLKIHSILIAKK